MRVDDHPDNHNSQSDDTGIVSVNSRGPGKRLISSRTAISLVAAAMLMAGAATAAYKMNKHGGAATTAGKPAVADTEKPPIAGIKKTFNIDPGSTGQAAAKAASWSVIETARCADGTEGKSFPGPDGRPVTAPSGARLRVCSDGNVIASSFMSADAKPAPSSPRPDASVSAAAFSPPTRRRFSGDSLLPSPAPSSALLSAADTDTPYVQSLLAQATLSPVPALSPGLPPPHRDAALALQPGAASAVRASLIGNRDLIVPQGRSIDCNLSVRVISEVSGKASCVLSSDVYSDNGRVVLAERGSTVIGDYVAHIEQGQRRLFILWTRLETTHGVIVNVNSPAADALGTSGLSGEVDNRWPERIGAAVLLSLVDDAIGYETAKASRGNGSQGVAVLQSTPQTSQHLAERVLDSTINIKPTIFKHQGDRAAIFVSRDLDFGSVYELQRQ
jgi:type IV secretion system protein VirB10